MKLHKFQIDRSQRLDGVENSYLDSMPSPYHIFDFWQKIRPTPTPPPSPGGGQTSKIQQKSQTWKFLIFEIFVRFLRFTPLPGEGGGVGVGRIFSQKSKV